MTVASPCGGKLAEWLVELNESYSVGSVLGHIQASQAQAARAGDH